MAFARVSVRGLKDVIDKCEKRAARARDLTPAMTRAATDLQQFAFERFNTATDGYGRPWKPLEPESLRRRAPGPPLQQSRKLLGSGFAIAHKRGLRYGNRAPYAMFQYKLRGWLPNTPTGSGIRANGTPARAFFGRVRETILAWVIDGKLR